MSPTNDEQERDIERSVAFASYQKAVRNLAAAELRHREAVQAADAALAPAKAAYVEALAAMNKAILGG